MPGWPGDSLFPPQAMVTRTRYVLDTYHAQGGVYEEFVVTGAGHAPHIERPVPTLSRLRSFLQNHCVLAG
ncbi:MAG: hypothetical protein M0Z41_20925 [Peptococcaceae bacterium]|nr:hypothetical protein [Peptococcaceae bacterium]